MGSHSKTGSSQDPFERIFLESGGSFHTRVAKAFRDAGWTVLLSPYYVDNATDKPREVDLICERLYFLKSQWNTDPGIPYRIQLLVECKYFSPDSAVVLWFDGRDERSVNQLIKSTYRIFSNNSQIDQHHYNNLSNSSVAKIFATSGSKGEDREPLYVAISQCMGAMIQLRTFPFLTTPPKHQTAGSPITARYPVVLCSSFNRFRRTDVQNSPLQPITSNFQFEINYAFTNSVNVPIREFGLVDVVSFELLADFLSALEKEYRAVRLLVTED